MVFLRQFKTADKACSHNGLLPTAGKFQLPDYSTDADVRRELFETIDAVRSAKTSFCIMENQHYLPNDFPTRYRIDLDVTLPSDNDAQFSPYIPKLVGELYSGLELRDGNAAAWTL